ncbi:MAG: pyridoxal phosphate-dependent decarboxylase family protein [Thermoanaerobaculia bacterium]
MTRGDRQLDEFLGASTERVKRFRERIRDARITPTASAAEVREHLSRAYGDFSAAWTADELVEDVARMMLEWNVHVTHPRYFGLFNPNVFPASVAADLLVAGFNPQLAAWSHAPAANEIESYTLAYLADRLGLDPGGTASTFTTAGAEANQSAVLAALTWGLTEYPKTGMAGVERWPVIYVSSESHHSVDKAAQTSGIGRRAIHKVDIDESFRLSPRALGRAIEVDRSADRRPLMVVGTAGTTGGGIIDPLAELAAVCADEKLWFHVDAAWGGAACLAPRLAPALAGIERADSITWDAHKWLSVPMGAGMFFCTHPKIVRRTFEMATPYMPEDVEDTTDPYCATIQWSRRNIGLKLFMALAALGSDGYRHAIEHQAEMGDRLRDELRERGWEIVNTTPLPVACFTRDEIEEGKVSADRVARLLEHENFWTSPVRLGNRVPVLRACITSYETTAEDVTALAEAATRVVLAESEPP